MTAAPSWPIRRRWRGGRAVVVALCAVLGALAFVPAAQAYTCGAAGDNFDRANSTNLGPNWTERVQNFDIAANQATQLSIGAAGVMTFNGSSASEACVDITHPGGSGLPAGGFTLNYASAADQRFVEVRDNDNGGTFDSIWFYSDTGGSAVDAMNLAAPFTSARLHVSETATTVTLDIDTNKDGTPEVTRTATFGTQGTTGVLTGLIDRSGVLLDNFTFGPPAPVVTPVSPLTPVTNPTGATPTGATRDTTKPVLGSLAFGAATFKAAKSGGSTSAKQKSNAPTGTKVSFRLSEVSSVKFTVDRTTTGRRVSGKCKAKTQTNRTKPKCTRYVKVAGSFTIAGKAGKNTFTFRGRMGGRALRPGSYRLNSQATDKAKNVAPVKRKGFKIVK